MNAVNRLLASLRGSHKPDAEALSALADGRLDPARARALETHMTACAVCAARLDELRRVKTMLAAMPQADAPRSFRLRQADVEAPARPAPVFMPGLLRAMPAASGVAALAFVLVLATDLSTRGGDGGRVASLQSAADSAPSSARMESKSAEAPAGASAADGDDQASDQATQYYDAGVTPAAEGLVPESSNIDGEGTPEAGIARVDAPAPGGEAATAVTGALEQDSPLDGAADDEALTQGVDEQEVGTLEVIVPEADDDDGGRMAFLVVEIMAGGVAIAAGAAYAVSRRNRRVQS